MKNDDVQLIHRILDGDDTVFTELVKKYQKSVHALVWRKIGDFHIAEEITQDIFLKAYQKLRTLKKPQHFASWLYVIASRCCVAWLRKKRVRTQPIEDTSSSQLEKATYSQYVIEENERTAAEAQRDVVKKLLAKLPESERTVITLYYFSEMSSAEIGAFLGVSANTIRSRLRRAQQRLQKEETMIREALEHFQISPNLTDNIMREVARLKPTSSGSKPFIPWAIAASTVILIVLMLGIGSQYLVRFQKPYSLDATSEMTVDIIETPVVLNLESKPDVRTQLVSLNALGKDDNNGQKPDEVLLAAAQTEGENVSVPKQEWIQDKPVKGSDVGALSVTSDGELYTVANQHLYKMESDGKEWQQITDLRALGVKYRVDRGFIKKWDDTLYLLTNTTLFASKDDGKTWKLVNTIPAGHSLYDFELTRQAFYIISADDTALRSEDTGKTWKPVNHEFPQKPKSMVVIQDTMFTGTFNGLYRLKDDNWQRVELPGPVGNILSVTSVEGKIYVAAGFSPDKTDTQKVRQGLARGWWIFRSTDLGDSWDDITPVNAWTIMGLPPEITLVAVGETLLAMERGMVRSNDGGNTWLPPQLPGTSPSMGRFSSAVVVNQNTIYVDSSDGLNLSTDGGISWDPVSINPQNWVELQNLIAYKESDKGQNMHPTLYARFAGDIVKTTDKGKSWRTIQTEVPMTAPVRDQPPIFSRIRESDGILYAKTDGWRRPGNEYKTTLYRISADGNTVMPIQGMPIFGSQELNLLWKTGRTGSLDVSDKPFVEQMKENSLGADQFFKALAQGKTLTQDELYQEELYQMQNSLIIFGLLHGGLAVSGDTYYMEYNFKLFRWRPGETEWYDTGVQETGEILRSDAWQTFQSAGLSSKKIQEIFWAWNDGFKLAASGNTLYVGKRDGYLVASFDAGNNWLDLTPALPFSVMAFKEIVFAGSTVYVATDAGVAASDNGKHWRSMTDAAGTNLVIEHLAVDGTKVYGITKNTGAYRLENGIWEQITSKISDRVDALAVDGNTLYVITYERGILHYNIDK